MDTATLVRLWAGNTEGDLRRVKLGTNLSISGDTLNAAGGGAKFAETTPAFFVGANTAKDTITEMKRDAIEYDNDNGTTTIYPLANVRIKNDTIVTLRGSHFEYYENSSYTKTLAATTTDTLDVDIVNTKFDFTTTGNGSFTLVNAPDEVPDVGFDGFVKLFDISATISLSADSIVDTEFSIYLDGGQLPQSVTEFQLDSNKKATITIQCQEWLNDGQTLDIRIRNTSGNQRSYTIERIKFGAHHIKSAFTLAS